MGTCTSSYYSPNLRRSFALALVKGGINKKGYKLLAPMPNKTIEVEITNPVFIDPSNERLSALMLTRENVLKKNLLKIIMVLIFKNYPIFIKLI